MRIAVCIKQVPDTKALIERDEEENDILQEEAYYICNRADKVAAEEAVRLRERLGGGEVILISLGSAKGEQALRECLSIGADRAILLIRPAFSAVDVSITAEVLAEAIRMLEVDLVLCGFLAEDIQSGAVGPMIAEVLGLPSVSNVNKIDIAENKKAILVHRNLARGDREVIMCPLPAVVTVDQEANRPRYASLPAHMRALTLDIEKRNSPAIDFKPKRPKLEIVNLTLPRPRLKKGLIIDSSLPAEERIKMFMGGGISRRETNIIEGSTQHVADKLVEYLASNNLMPKASQGCVCRRGYKN